MKLHTVIALLTLGATCGLASALTGDANNDCVVLGGDCSGHKHCCGHGRTTHCVKRGDPTGQAPDRHVCLLLPPHDKRSAEPEPDAEKKCKKFRQRCKHKKDCCGNLDCIAEPLPPGKPPGGKGVPPPEFERRCLPPVVKRDTADADKNHCKKLDERCQSSKDCCHNHVCRNPTPSRPGSHEVCKPRRSIGDPPPIKPPTSAEKRDAEGTDDTDKHKCKGIGKRCQNNKDCCGNLTCRLPLWPPVPPNHFKTCEPNRGGPPPPST